MNFDVAKARRETPGAEETLHFNNAGAALMPQLVLDSVVSHLQLEAKIGGYEAANLKQDEIDHVYSGAAKLLNCHRDEIAVVENATRAWDMIFYSLPFKPGDRILTAASEYCSNYIAYLQVKNRCGVQVEVIPDDEHGQVCIKALEKLIDERVKLISITHVPSAGGLVNPAAEIGQLARRAQIPYLLDACQSIGQRPVDVKAIGCDFLSSTGRKYLRGPRGTGFLYVNKERLDLLEPPFLDIHAADWTSKDSYDVRPDARRFENWETNYACKIGLAVAIRYALDWGIEAIQARVTLLADRLRSGLSELGGVTVVDQGVERCGIVTFAAKGFDLARLKNRLLESRVNVHLCRAESNRLGLESRSIAEAIRASVHYYNTEQEVDRFCLLVDKILADQLTSSASAAH